MNSAQQIWFFVVVDAHEHRLAHAQCDFMGQYAGLMNQLSITLFGEGWMAYTTFTLKDYDQQLHGHLGIDPLKLPIYRQQFQPEAGLARLGHLRQHLQLHESNLIEQAYVRASDFGELMRDIDAAIDVLQQGVALGKGWFLDTLVED
jgi:hypothetical protein